MKHSNAEILEKVYEYYAKGNLAAVLGACSDKVTFQIMGKSKLAGKYTKETFPQFVSKIQELSGGTYRLDVHDIMANDRHGVVLASGMLEKKGEKSQIRTVHVWRFEEGKIVAWYEYPRDLYQFDSLFS
jgi:uncharacterized protein